MLEVIYTRTARCCKSNLSGIFAIKRLHLRACWLTLPGKVAIELGWRAHPVLQYCVINIHTVDLVAVDWQPVPAILDPEDGKTCFGGQVLLHRIVHRLWMDAVCQPERNIDLPLTACGSVIEDGKVIAIMELQAGRIERTPYWSSSTMRSAIFTPRALASFSSVASVGL